MMDVRRFNHAVDDINRNTIHKVATFMLIKKCHNTFVSSTVPCLQRNQTCRRKERSIDGSCRIFFAIYSINDIFYVIGIARFIRAAVHLTENTTPIPLGQNFDGIRAVTFWLAKNCTDHGQRYQLRRIWQIPFSEHTLILQQKVTSKLETCQNRISICDIRIILQSQHIFFLTGYCPCFSRFLIHIARV